MAELDVLDRVVLLGLARAGHIVHVHAKRVTHAVREERRADSARENRLLRVPRARVRGIRCLEDTEALEAPYERAMADELDRVPVQTRLKCLEGELEVPR